MNNRNNLTSFLSYFLYFSGAAWGFRQVNRQRRRIPILMYHSIFDDTSTKNDQSYYSLIGMSVSKTCFISHMEIIRDRYQTIQFSDIVQYMTTGSPLPPRPIILTFDDGLRDNFSVAYPILKQYDLTATFFIIGNTLIERGYVWLHILYDILDSLDGKSFQFSREDIHIDETSLTEKRKLLVGAKLKKILFEVHYDTKISILKDICDQNGIDFPTVADRSQYMSESDLRRLHCDGFEIGAHSMTHDNLSMLTDRQKEEEIVRSSDIIRNITTASVVPFSYPYGTKASFDSVLIKILKNNSINCAVTTIEGMNSDRSDMYALKRIEIGNFNRFKFEAHLSGAVGDIKLLMKKLSKRIRK